MMIEYLNKKEAVLYTDFSNSVRTADVYKRQGKNSGCESAV